MASRFEDVIDGDVQVTGCLRAFENWCDENGIKKRYALNLSRLRVLDTMNNS